MNFRPKTSPTLASATGASAPTPVSTGRAMDVQPDIDLVSIFNEVFLVQTYLHKLEIIEEIITDISDFVEDQALLQPSVQLNAMRQQVGQVKIQLRFLLQLKLLEACRRLRQHVLQYGHLPLLNLDFRR